MALRRMGLVVVPAGLALTAAGVFIPAAHAADGFKGTFGAVASADAVRVTWIVPHAPASDTVLDAGGPSAQATLDSIGGSQAYASFPYPGENTVTAPALVAGASGGKINLPAYPFWVGSTYPVAPKSEAGSGPYSIKAQSSDTESNASASVGLASSGQAAVGLARSTASTATAPEAVTSEAVTEVTAFAVGPLKIGQVLSRAKAVFSGTGTLARDADTQVTGMMIADTPVAFTAKGLVIGSSAVPADPKPVESALAQAKIGLEYMPRQDTDGGVVAPTIRVTQKDDSGGSITYVLGRASAFAQGAGDAPGAAPDASTSPDTSGSGSGRSATAQPDQASSSTAPPAVQAAALAPVAPEPGETGTQNVDVPTSFVVPDPQPTAAPSSAAVGSTVVPARIQLASNAPGSVAAAAGPADGRRLAAGILFSAGDTSPMFVALLAGLVAALGSALLVRRLGKRMR
ncbi:MAG TPA: hypothetical protein VKX24_01030 [Acidimicrobiia bacterium]|nr:hypothetical protein [Acidimicrobiia bacterium]HZQ77460.1 hypothetical protein [Acidimicrobiia bacterium]